MELAGLKRSAVMAGLTPSAHSPDTDVTTKKENLPNGKKTKGRVKIKMEFIDNKLRRYTTFSKRKTGIMKKAYELSTLTGTQVMLLVASETGHVYTFATRKLQPMITSEAGKVLIQTCLNSPDDTENEGLEDDQRMSAAGFEETELSYAAEDKEDEDEDYNEEETEQPVVAPSDEEEEDGPYTARESPTNLSLNSKLRTEYSSANASSCSSSATIFVKSASALSQPSTSQTPSHYQIPAGYAPIPPLSAADISICSPAGRSDFSRGDNAKPPTLAPKLQPSLPPELLAQLEYSSQLSQMALAASGGEGWNRKHVILAPSSGGGGGSQGQLILLPVSTTSTTSPLYQTSLSNVKSEPSLSPQNLSLRKESS